jgi:phospholipid/cholesterol/gamma-HCH transport system ATP-binding protein
VIMVSSDLDRLLPVTDRIGMMYRGRLMFDGTTDEARAASEPHVRQFVHGLTEGPL